MRKLILAITMFVLTINSINAQSETGFATSGDIMVGYKSKIVQTTLGYDFGYRVFSGLYIGAGPMAAVGFGNGNASFSAGGYGKVRYTLPIEFNIKPFIDGRVGYAHNFEAKSGGLFYGAGLGLKISEHFCIGITCHMPKSSEITKERYIVKYEKKYNPIDKKTYNVPIYGTREVKNNKLQFVPTLLVSMQF